VKLSDDEMTDEVKLGDVAFVDKLSSSEKTRLSKLLSEPDSLAAKVFTEFAPRARGFAPLAKSLHRKIHGFRPNSEMYKVRALEFMLHDLARDAAPPSGWVLYQEAIGGYVEKSIPSLHLLMREVDAEKRNLATEEFFLKVCESAQKYSVYDNEVRTLYELWPFERTEELESLIERCPRVDRHKGIEDSVLSLKTEMKDLKKSIDQRIVDKSKEIEPAIVAGLVTEQENIQTTLDNHRDEIKNLRLKLEKEYSASLQSLAGDFSEFSSRLENINSKILEIEQNDVVPESNEWNEQVNQTILELNESHQKLHHQLDSLTESQNASVWESQLNQATLKISESHKKLQYQVDLLSELQNASLMDNVVLKGESPFQLLRSAVRKEPNLKSRSEADFVARLTEPYAVSEAVCNNLKIFHAALVSSPILVTSFPKYVKEWVSAANWESDAISTTASPVWCSVEDWKEELHVLLSSQNNAAIVTIYNFDIGYLDGYLEPILRAWGEQKFTSNMKRLVLVPSGQQYDYSLKSPALWVDQLMSADSLSLLNHEKLDTKLPYASILEWQTGNEDIANRALTEVIAVCDALDINPTDALVNFLSLSLGDLIWRLPNVESQFDIALKSILGPWAKANCATTTFNELTAYGRS